jgi:predicted MFS family arabinose efflux permease
VQRVAVGWLTWELTQSSTWIGVVAFANLFPVVVLGPFGGLLADRVQLPRIVLVCQTLQLGQSLVLFALTALDLITIWALLGLTCFNGITVAFHQPARLTMAPSLVRPQDLAAAIAINSVVFNGARFVGPAVAGIIITQYGIAPAFATNSASFAAMIVAVLCLRLPPRAASRRPAAGVFTPIKDGMRYGFTDPAIGPLLCLTAATALLAFPLHELLPSFADAVFHRGAAGLAILTSALGIGAVTGGVWLAQRGTVVGLTTITLSGAGVCCLGVIVFTGTSLFWVAVAAVAVTGFSMVSTTISTQTMIQTAVSGAMRGRVLSLWGIIVRGGTALGALAMGWLTSLFGSGLPLAAGAVLCLVAVVAVLTRRHQLTARIEARGSLSG